MASVSGGISASTASAMHPARSLHLRIILLLASLILCVPMAQAQQRPSSDHLRNASQTNVAQKTRTETVAKAKTPDSVKDESKARSDSWLAWLTGALVLVALGQAVVFFYQWRQLKETVKATRANVAALTSAERAHLSFEHLEIIDERSPSQRIYPKDAGDINSPISVCIDLKNYGRTPATITAFWIAPVIVDTFECSELTHPHGTVSLAQPMAPNASDTRARSIALDDWSEVVGGNKKLVIYGHAEYRDIFGQSHISGFACLYIPPGTDQDEKFASVCLESRWYND